jgi:hypothetical protein
VSRWRPKIGPSTVFRARRHLAGSTCEEAEAVYAAQVLLNVSLNRQVVELERRISELLAEGDEKRSERIDDPETVAGIAERLFILLEQAAALPGNRILYGSDIEVIRMAADRLSRPFVHSTRPVTVRNITDGPLVIHSEVLEPGDTLTLLEVELVDTPPHVLDELDPNTDTDGAVL